MKKAGIYVRVSTKKQKFDSQEPDLIRWAQSNGTEQVKWYRDKFTGRTMSRPGFDKLIKDIQDNRIDTIVIWRLDRLGRSAAGLTALFRQLKDWNVNLVSIRDNFDLKTANGRLLANMLASVAQYESELRSERITAGQEAARQKGKKWGGSKKGCRAKRTAEKIDAVLELNGRGMAKTKISRTVGLSVPTIYSIIRDNMQKKGA